MLKRGRPGRRAVRVALAARVGRWVGQQAAGRVAIGADPADGSGAGDGLHDDGVRGGGQRRHRDGGGHDEEDSKGERARHNNVCSWAWRSIQLAGRCFSRMV